MRLRATSLARTAYHEAGHVVLAHIEGLTVLGASIERDRDSFGRVFYRHGTSLAVRNLMDGRARRRVDAFVVCYLGGAEAEAKFAGRRDREGAMADIGTAMDFAGQVVLCDEEMTAYLRWLSVRARYLVTMYWALINGLARQLLRSQTMSAREVAETMRELSAARRTKSKVKRQKASGTDTAGTARQKARLRKQMNGRRRVGRGG